MISPYAWAWRLGWAAAPLGRHRSNSAPHPKPAPISCARQRGGCRRRKAFAAGRACDAQQLFAGTRLTHHPPARGVEEQHPFAIGAHHPNSDCLLGPGYASNTGTGGLAQACRVETHLRPAGALHQLEGFASEHGPRFYGLPLNEGTVTLKRQPQTLPESLPFGDAVIKPLRAGETLNWTLT